MSRRNPKKQIRKLVQMLTSRYDVSTVYIEDIADCLECARDVVEAELGLLWEQGVLEPVLECTVACVVVSSPSMHRLVTW